jgi:diacylglycerol kinase (ATP)
MKFAIAYNIKSGRGSAPQIAKKLVASLEARGHSALLVNAPDVESMRGALAALAKDDSVSAFVSVGGDGLAHLVINACAQTSIPMYTVSAGTGNDFARTNNQITTDIDFITDRLTTEAPVEIDLGLIRFEQDGVARQEYFGQVLSTGFDSLVNKRANRMKWVRGQMKYNIATLLELPFFRPIEYELELDGTTINSSAMLVAVANGPTYGGGMKILPGANRHDGELDLLLLKPVSKIELLRVFPRVFKGTHVTHSAVEIFRSKQIALRAKALAYADGEYISSLPIEISIAPKALRTWEAA